MKPKLNIVSPLPPKKSGIANYALKVSASLAQHYEITFVVDQVEFDTADADVGVIQFDEFITDTERRQNLSLLHMGNNPDHEHVYRAADYVAGLVVQHDLVLHHFIESITLAEGKFDEYSRIMQQEYGEAGKSLVAARRAGIFDDSSKFLFPAVSHFVRKGVGAIVHSEWAARRLSPVMGNNLFCIPHFVEDEILTQSSNVMRKDPVAQAIYERFGIPEDRFVIGSLGFATQPKCVREVGVAILQMMDLWPDLHLVIGGEMHMPDLADELRELYDAGRITVTGYLDRQELEFLCARIDLLFNLRFPIAGESSGILSMAMGFGTPCAVFDFGPMSELEQSEAFLIPFRGTDQVLVEDLIQFLQRLQKLPRHKIVVVGMNGKKRMQQMNAVQVVTEKYKLAIDTVLGV